MMNETKQAEPAAWLLEARTVEEEVVQATLDRVLHWSREVADLDTNSPDGLFHAMQYLAQNLAGLKKAIRDYDTLLDHIAKQEKP